jgi:hypothetical protein
LPATLSALDVANPLYREASLFEIVDQGAECRALFTFRHLGDGLRSSIALLAVSLEFVRKLSPSSVVAFSRVTLVNL